MKTSQRLNRWPRSSAVPARPQPAARPKLTHFYKALSNLFETEQTALDQDDPGRDRVTHYVRKNPRAAISPLATASALLGHGMACRGYGYPGTNSREPRAFP
mgnify:CR=1 FL=1